MAKFFALVFSSLKKISASLRSEFRSFSSSLPLAFSGGLFFLRAGLFGGGEKKIGNLSEITFVIV